jgi:hypothetical protein
VPRKTEICFERVPKNELKAGNREKRNDPQQAFHTRLIALCATVLAMNLIGCGGDAGTETASKPIVAQPSPAASPAENSVREPPVSKSVDPISDSSSDTTTDSPSAAEDSASSVSNENDWNILFCASDPTLWNTASDGENAFSIALDDFSDEIQWLRMRRIDTNEGAIIPLTRDDLLKVKELDDGVFWNGTGRRVTSTGKTHRKLGIVSRAFNRRYKSKAVLILNPPKVSGSGWSGWGFGKIALIHSPQYFAWAGERIPETVFEISVTNGDLSPDEKTQLVLPKYGLSASSKVVASTPAGVNPPTPESTQPTPAAVAVFAPVPNATTAVTKKVTVHGLN